MWLTGLDTGLAVIAALPLYCAVTVCWPSVSGVGASVDGMVNVAVFVVGSTFTVMLSPSTLNVTVPVIPVDGTLGTTVAMNFTGAEKPEVVESWLSCTVLPVLTAWLTGLLVLGARLLLPL